MSKIANGMEIIGDFRQGTKDKLGHWDCPTEGELVLTIKKCVWTTTRSKTGEEELKPYIYFEETDKPLICNATNRKTIEQLYGPRTESNTWYGAKVGLYDAPVPQADDGRGIRIRPYIPRVETAKCAACGKEITAHDKYSVNKIVELTRAKYGEALCWDCGQKRKEESE